MHRILRDHVTLHSRRAFLQNTGMGLGATALGALAQPTTDGRVIGPHHAPRAKRVIFLFMAGAPSQLDLFDYKPNLAARFKEPLPDSVSMAALSMAVSSGGAISAFKTTPLIPMQEAVEAMGRVGRIGYRPPEG